VLADDVDSDSDVPNKASSSNKKGKQKLKRGPLSDEAREEISTFSTEVLGMADVLADRHKVSRQTVLITAGLGIRESRRENIANIHSKWYAATHPKPDGSTYYYLFSLPF
jgi:hypothetical protein